MTPFGYYKFIKCLHEADNILSVGLGPVTIEYDASNSTFSLNKQSTENTFVFAREVQKIVGLLSKKSSHNELVNGYAFFDERFKKQRCFLIRRLYRYKSNKSKPVWKIIEHYPLGGKNVIKKVLNNAN